MTERLARLLAIPVALSLAIPGGACSRRESPADAPARPPVLVLISIDTLRPDHLGVYGYERPTSPRLDALARGGVLFEDAASPSPWTLPSHASLLTGRYPARHGLKSHAKRLADDVPTLAEELQAAGWETAAVVNSHNLSDRYGLERGFQRFEYVAESAHQVVPSRRITDRALAWLADSLQRPLFLFLHYYDVHSDYISLDEYEEEFVGPYEGSADGSTEELIAFRRGLVELDADDARHLVDRYDAGIRQMDDELGRLLDFLAEHFRERLVVVTSDHGEEFLEHGDVLHGRTQYVEVLAIPLIVNGTHVPAGRRIAAPVSLVDVLPTLLSLAGAPIPDGVDGRDLSPLVRGQAEVPGADVRAIFGEADHHNAELDQTRSIRKGRYKLHFDRVERTHRLYDLETDPGERVDLAKERPELAARLLAELMAFADQDAGVDQERPLSPAETERLKSLGYLQ